MAEELPAEEISPFQQRHHPCGRAGMLAEGRLATARRAAGEPVLASCWR
jgi:hypothetical protein